MASQKRLCVTQILGFSKSYKIQMLNIDLTPLLVRGGTPLFSRSLALLAALRKEGLGNRQKRTVF